jgi:hypothetical protein
MQITKRPIKLRDGTEVLPGCTVTWEAGKATIHTGEKNLRVSGCAAARALGIQIPTIEDLEEWNGDGVCESVLGETVEPDGIDEHGSPSWLLVMGLI